MITTSDTLPASLSDLPALGRSLTRIDAAAAKAARDRQDNLTKPPGSLGRLEDIAVFMAGWQGSDRPRIDTAQALVFAGNHGICARGVNAFPQAVTAQMVANFEAGGAAINQLCKANGAALSVIALNLDTPTADFTEGPAMTEAEVLSAWAQGAGAVNPDADILILGEMGIGNSTIAAAAAASAYGGAPGPWVGRGTGVDDDGLDRKTRAVSDGVARHGRLSGGAILTAFGGYEQAAICGAVAAARAARIPVILDGYICTSAVSALHTADEGFLDHCIVAHLSAEPGHARLLDAMGKTAILGFDMRLGEGSGAALALGVVRSALACHNGMATFAEAGVSGG